MKGAKYWQLISHIGLAISAFLIAYLLLSETPAPHYGSFAFILVLQAFGFALSNALIASPLLILMNDERQSAYRDAVPQGFLVVAFVISIAIATMQGCYLWFSLTDFWISISFAVAGFLQQLRWYGRCEWQNRNVRVLLVSDLLFSASLLMGGIALWWFNVVSLLHIGLLLVLVSVIALVPFLASFYASCRQHTDWIVVKQGFEQQGRPALFGVLTVEATANFHSYLVVFGSGSAAFAPIAAAMLFFRPLAVVLGSLLQSERPRLVQARMAGDLKRLLSVTAGIRHVAVASFMGNALILLLLFIYWPALLWPEPDSRQEFLLALVLWSLVAGCRALRSSATAWMQAADLFAPLARVTYLSAAWTIPAVLVTWWLAGPIASLSGVLSGEVLLCLLLWRVMQKHRSQAEAKIAIATPRQTTGLQ